MYCPKCSQQQISDSVRFCSRCGFALGPVAELLNGDETLAGRQAKLKKKPSLLQHRGTRIGAKLLFFSMVAVPLAVVFSIIFDSPVPLLLPFILFLVGLTQTLYARIFGESAQPEKGAARPTLSSENERRFEQPLAQPAPMPQLEAQRHNTAEIVPPPSVTERTTTLLKNK